MTTYVLTVTCPSTRGIVAALSGFLARAGYNILRGAQFDDISTGRFFMRVSFATEEEETRLELKVGLKPIVYQCCPQK